MAKSKEQKAIYVPLISFTQIPASGNVLWLLTLAIILDITHVTNRFGEENVLSSLYYGACI